MQYQKSLVYNFGNNKPNHGNTYHYISSEVFNDFLYQEDVWAICTNIS